MLLYQLLALKNGLAHFDAQFFAFIASCDNTPVIIGKYDNRLILDSCVKYAFAGDIEVVAINECKDLLSHLTL